MKEWNGYRQESKRENLEKENKTNTKMKQSPLTPLTKVNRCCLKPHISLPKNAGEKKLEKKPHANIFIWFHC